MNEAFHKDKIMFITRGLEKILSDRDIKRSYNQQLKKACESTLGLYLWMDSVNLTDFITRILVGMTNAPLCSSFRVH